MKAARTSQVHVRIAEIEAHDRAACLNAWRTAFGRPPPKHLSQAFMKKVLIWDAQTQQLGGVSAKTDRRLRQIATGGSVAAVAKPGSHLVREWNGRTYQVEVTDAESTTSHRIRLVTDLAFLSPTLIDAIAAGTQPDGLTTDRLIRANIPAD